MLFWHLSGLTWCNSFAMLMLSQPELTQDAVEEEAKTKKPIDLESQSSNAPKANNSKEQVERFQRAMEGKSEF